MKTKANASDAKSFIDVEVRRGMFSKEYAVRIETADGEVLLMAPAADLQMVRPPRGRGIVKGKLRVHPVGKKGGDVFVDLPQPALNQGSRIVVPVASLRSSVA